MVVRVLWLVLISLVSCQKNINTQEIKEEIKNWWGVEEIEDIAIDDVAQQKNSVKILARVVILTDTLERLAYEFEKFEKGWKLVNEPLDRFTKAMFIESIDDMKYVKLLENMHHLQLAVEDWSTISGGLYPPTLTTKISNIVKNSKDTTTVLSLLPIYHFINPYYLEAPPVCMGSGPSSIYKWEYVGKAVYFPDSIFGFTTYEIKGADWSNFIGVVFKWTQ